MLFNSNSFLFLFLPIIFLGYFFSPKLFKKFSHLGWLLFGSILFYTYWDFRFVFLLILSVSVNYSLGNILRKNKDVNFLIYGILFNLLILGYFKYKNFFIENLNILFSTDLNLNPLILPLGISFFTFQQIAYLVDMKNDNNPEKDSFLKYFLFVSFFPQLIAGPIVKHKDIIGQFNYKKISNINYKNIAIGLSIFSIGLFKKTFIADNLSMIVDPIFLANENSINVSFFEAWSATIAYSFQIYFDFSAYSEMALGLALLFNIKLPFNFTSPYKSRNISIFWRNWHITLSSFFRDYLYYPLSVFIEKKFSSKLSLFKTNFDIGFISILIVFLLIGLWHGGGWNFLFFGLLHGLGIIFVNEINKVEFIKKIQFQYIGVFTTFIFVSLSFVFFRSESFSSAINMMSSLAGLNGISISPRFEFFLNNFEFFNFLKYENFFNNALISKSSAEVFLMLLISAFICFFMPNIKEIFFSEKNAKKITYWKPNMIWLILSIMFFTFGFIYMNHSNQFLYFEF